MIYTPGLDLGGHIKNIFIITFYFLSFSSNASLGIKVLAESIPSGLCRITLLNQKTGDEFHCTGSVIGKHIIKTAAHCLNNSEVRKIQCIGADEVTLSTRKLYPSYDQDLLETSIENRYQDQALLKVFEDLSAISFTPLLSSHSLDMTSFSQCLMAGFGLQEKSLTKTGFLSGSIIPKHQDNINLHSGIITVNGAYFVELLPGDSGGPLLCYKDNTWFDLGTASAHSWEHESIYSSNDNLSFSDWNFTKKQNKISRPAESRKRATSKQPSFLAPYSTVQTLEGELFYNGDLDFVTLINVESINTNQVRATIKVDSASVSFLCLGSFLCYGDIKEVVISKHDILDSRFHFPSLHDPFK